MRHDFAGSGDLHDQIDIDRIQQEGNLRGTAIDGIERRGGFAFVGKIGFGGHGVWSDAEGGLENALVKQNHVQFALQRRKAGEDLGEVRFGAQASADKTRGWHLPALGRRRWPVAILRAASCCRNFAALRWRCACRSNGKTSVANHGSR